MLNINIQPKLKGKVIVAFRNDDIQEFSGSKLDLALFELFKAHKIPQTYALVPFKVDFVKNERLMKILKGHLASGLAEIALHGYAHENLGKGRLRTEFLGRPLDEQRKKINKGKAYLESVFNTEIISFIPPFNSYDLNTVNACKENGIKVLSSSFFYYSRRLLSAISLIRNFRSAIGSILSHTIKNKDDIIIVNPNQVLTDPVIEQIELASKNCSGLSIFIIYYHSYMGNIYVGDDYYGRLQRLISYINSKDNIEVMTLGQVGIDYSEYFKQRYKKLWAKLKFYKYLKI